MKKFYHKKDLSVEESPLTLQLQRRHTVVEGDKDNAKVVTKLKPVCRSNSTSSIYRPPKTAKDLSSHKGYLESTLSINTSGASSASTVVITESQLSSSWLYNNKKAQMCSKSPKKSISAGESSFRQASDNEEGKFPAIHRPKVKSISSQSTRSSKKCSSCCCYAAIVILACFAFMGIISTIGGIVYMEFFSGSNKTQSQGDSAIGRSGDVSYTKQIGHVNAGGDSISQDLSRDGIRDSSSELKEELEILNHLKDSNKEKSKNKSKESGNILRVKKVKKNIPSIDDKITNISHMTHEVKLQEESNEKQNVHQVNFQTPGTQNNSPYSKLFELYKGIYTNINKNLNPQQESSSFKEDKLNSKVTDKEDTFELVHKSEKESDNHARLFDEAIDTNESSESLDSNSEVHFDTNESSESLDPNSEVRFDTNESSESLDPNSEVHFDTNESPESLDPSPEVHFDTNESLESLDPNSEEHSEESFAIDGVKLLPKIPKYFFRRPSQDSGESLGNVFSMTRESDANNSEEQLPNQRLLPHIPKLSDMTDADENVNIKLDKNSPDTLFSTRDLLDESVKSDLDFNLNSSHEPRGEVLEPVRPKNFNKIPTKDTDLNFRIFDPDTKRDVDNSEESSLPRFLPHIPEFSDQNDASDSIVGNLESDNQESDLPLELNRPVSEAKIAVPGPLDLIRRFTMGEPDNKGNSEMEQHDRRFFFAQALERLRSLDVRNILPSSRQKNNSKRNSEQKFEPKIQSEQEVFTERSNYLQKLRHRLYEQ